MAKVPLACWQVSQAAGRKSAADVFFALRGIQGEIPMLGKCRHAYVYIYIYICGPTYIHTHVYIYIYLYVRDTFMHNVIWAFWPPEANQSISQRPLELKLEKVLKVLKLLIPEASGRPLVVSGRAPGSPRN